MQLRFLASAGPSEVLDAVSSQLAGASERCIEPILRAPGLAVWTPLQAPSLVSEDGSGALVGLLFDRAGGARQQRLPSPLPAPADFTERYWGAYVLFVSDPDGHRILRDPSGGVTAYHRRAGPLDVYASDLPMLASVAEGSFEPDLTFLRHWLAYPYLRTHRTGLEGITEILPGQVRCAGPQGPHESPAWSPWVYASPELAIKDFGAAAAHLRDAILLAVPRLAQAGSDVVVQLSGGLDSSIVAAALAATDRPFRALNFVTHAPDGDERTYAHEVARHCRIELAELAEEPASVDLACIPPLSVRPPPNPLLQPLHRTLASHLVLTGADCVLDGSGGDNVFCYLGSAAPALDALRWNGARAGLLVVHDLARLYGTTSWAVCRAAWRRRRRPMSWPRDESFLARGIATDAESHPWLDRSDSMLRGSYEQVQSIVGVRHFLSDPAPGEIAALHPLLAQPVLEACLRIPSWLWVRGGRDRAVARAAFRGLLPERILSRRSKGRLASLVLAGYMARRGALESLLLEGKLAQAGLIDRAAIRAYLRNDAEPQDPGYVRLLALTSAESWLRAFER